MTFFSRFQAHLRAYVFNATGCGDDSKNRWQMTKAGWISMRILYLNKRKDKMSLRGVLISGGAGSGKTSLVLSMVERSCFGAEAPAHTEVVPANEVDEGDSTLVKLSGQLVGYHFCQVRMILFVFSILITFPSGGQRSHLPCTSFCPLPRSPALTGASTRTLLSAPEGTKSHRIRD